MSAADLRTARVYYLVFGKDGPDPKVQRGPDERRGLPAQCAVEGADDPLHARP